MESTGSHFKRFIFILIDGAPYEIFKGLIENGDLPNIKKHVVDRGSLNKASPPSHQQQDPPLSHFLWDCIPARQIFRAFGGSPNQNFIRHTASDIPASVVIWDLTGCALKPTYLQTSPLCLISSHL